MGVLTEIVFDLTEGTEPTRLSFAAMQKHIVNSSFCSESLEMPMPVLWLRASLLPRSSSNLVKMQFFKSALSRGSEGRK